MQNTVGIFGKLPGHGDFVQRQLPGSFVSVWDEWLQRAVFGSRELVGQEWLDYYLTSPIWRFVHCKGVIDANAWAGILVPSVDSVGRYFPLTFATPLSPVIDAFAFMSDAKNWFQSLSELAITALQNMLHADQLCEAFSPPPEGAGIISLPPAQEGFIISSGQSNNLERSFAGLLGQMGKNTFSTYSLWWSEGSQHLAPTALLSPSLPGPELYSSMLGVRQQQQL
ncbi:type VI secretion system-associated protein TagF [Microbulbifer sp. JMSA004]|uniref:type VI secretion system-associated protein TagF n=1 Tax=unclassified Microbulbifer TaxID=2619833 RepID=UPI0024ACABB6|nr:type VI secretion system-associated protein TagF [Microbulbifer sp. VAAF005]WHI44531.1 type VI secretion system-associated protein TagF [Microbulbifer sp. VAAF005]